MSSPIELEPDSRTPLQVWRAFSFRLAAIAVGSIVIAALLVPYAMTPDGRDALYVGVAWQFAAWGLIDLFFAVSGIRETSTIAMMNPPQRETHVRAKVERILKILRSSRWQNLAWLILGAITLACGFYFRSASTAGHGVGVVLQATLLVFFDLGFTSALKRSLSTDSPARQSGGAKPSPVC